MGPVSYSVCLQLGHRRAMHLHSELCGASVWAVRARGVRGLQGAGFQVHTVRLQRSGAFVWVHTFHVLPGQTFVWQIVAQLPDAGAM